MHATKVKILSLIFCVMTSLTASASISHDLENGVWQNFSNTQFLSQENLLQIAELQEENFDAILELTLDACDPVNMVDPLGFVGESWSEGAANNLDGAMTSGASAVSTTHTALNLIPAVPETVLRWLTDIGRLGSGTADAIYRDDLGMGGKALSVLSDVARLSIIFAPAAKSLGAEKPCLNAAKGANKVDDLVRQIEQSGAKVKLNPKTASQEGNVTLDFGKEGRINLRVETHPLEPGGPPVRHANVETVTEIGGKKKVVNIHITE